MHVLRSAGFSCNSHMIPTDLRYNNTALFKNIFIRHNGKTMLQIRDISKEYRTGNLVQKALDHVSLNLRDNEFVAILGPSGSGKTTLLNIIGGLDRYDSGDLIINGISTKRYKDRDWDSYRNHTIGFVFQSYNLIPHQTILANVELALTISGISRRERKQRALEALEKVGLGEQAHKKPSQMSGGQMQRVAIARALVNDPDILLADEPTGALDSETSVQVMDLLKEVASDRLVVMVTHNPELAEQYATRIVNLKDGVIRSDSDPYIVDENETAVHKNMGRSSMSFLTALSLSFNNLRTKLARTVLVAFAGSIGIIGIALILSLSNGVNKYIKDTEEETLLGYPVQITSTSFDLTTMVAQNAEAQSGNSDDSEEAEAEKTDDVVERAFINRMLSRTKSNDLASLKTYLENESNIYDYASAVEYTYSVTPHIYRLNEDGYRQVNPDNTFAAMGFGGNSSSSAFASAMTTSVFNSLPKEEKLYKDSYDIKAGHWPENNRELLLVLYPDGSISDFMLYTLGIRDAEELDAMIKAFMNEEPINTNPTKEHFSYDRFLGIQFKLVNSAKYYRYDKEYEVWVDKSEDEAFMRNVVRDGEDLTIVGVAVKNENSDVSMLTSGIYYPYDMVAHVTEVSERSDITQDQLKDSTLNVFTGKDFTDTEQPEMNFGNMFTVNTDLLGNAFKFDTSKLQIDASAFSDLSGMDFSSAFSPDAFSLDMSSLPDLDLESMFRDVDVDVDLDEAGKLMREVMESYLASAAKDPTTNYSELPQAFREYLNAPQTRELIRGQLAQIIENSGYEVTVSDLTEAMSDIMAGYTAWLPEHIDPENPDVQPTPDDYLETPEGQAVLQAAVQKIIDKQSEDAQIRDEDIETLVAMLAGGYEAYAATAGNVPDPAKAGEAFRTYLEKDGGMNQITNGLSRVVDMKDLEKQVTGIVEENSAAFGESISTAISGAMTSVMGTITTQIADSMQKSMESFASQIPNAISFDTSVFARAFTMTVDEQDMEDLMMSLMSSAQYTYDGNLRKFGYADLNKPATISIYPRDFDSKAEVINLLDSYNEEMRKVDEDKVITYTDFVGTLMSSVTTIVDTVSYVLIAFVAISLVVSSIMIGVITYISVLERRKEIGILRAIGASKRNISEVFNAETFIIGLLAGLFGIGITRLLLIPGNYLIHTIADNQSVNAYLPVRSGLILIALSVVLTLIGGIIPSRKAAKSDPVTALRTE